MVSIQTTNPSKNSEKANLSGCNRGDKNGNKKLNLIGEKN